jgi:GNAT superfamily N-acetyltransferase
MDRDGIRALLRAGSIHLDPLPARNLRDRDAGDLTGTSARLPRFSLYRTLSPLLRSGRDWWNCLVAVSDEGKVIGCVLIRSHRGGWYEVTSVTVDREWRRRGVATTLLSHILQESPRPLWGTCPEVLIPFYHRFGAVAVDQADLMPPFIRRRWRWFAFYMRLFRKRGSLAVMMLDD